MSLPAESAASYTSESVSVMEFVLFTTVSRHPRRETTLHLLVNILSAWIRHGLTITLYKVYIALLLQVSLNTCHISLSTVHSCQPRIPTMLLPLTFNPQAFWIRLPDSYSIRVNHALLSRAYQPRTIPPFPLPSPQANIQRLHTPKKSERTGFDMFNVLAALTGSITRIPANT